MKMGMFWERTSDHSAERVLKLTVTYIRMGVVITFISMSVLCLGSLDINGSHDSAHFFMKYVESFFFCIHQFTHLNSAFTYSGFFCLAGFINNALF